MDSKLPGNQSKKGNGERTGAQIHELKTDQLSQGNSVNSHSEARKKYHLEERMCAFKATEFSVTCHNTYAKEPPVKISCNLPPHKP